jgi:hypothetical protein
VAKKRLVDRGQTLFGQCRIRFLVVEDLEKLFGASVDRKTLRKWPRKKFGKKVRAGFRHFKQRFVHEVLEHVLTPDIHDEREPGVHRRDVCKILIGTDPQINASRPGPRVQFRDHPLKRTFVRNEIVRTKISALLGTLIDDVPEFRIRQLLGQALHCELRTWRVVDRDERKHNSETGTEQQSAAVRHSLILPQLLQ